MIQWYMFMISLGCLIIMLSTYASSPVAFMVIGLVIAVIGAYKIFKKK